ncbi:MAG: VapC toxin family PIN domain ribonuclease [Sphingomonadaceae bacterium]|nr:VapC toxin family PIN domain ribonuclease [Sphingomonadaceae bacterium]
MILADTSVWVDHFRTGNARLHHLLDRGEILIHAFVIGELMLGGVKGNVLADLRALPSALQAVAGEVETFIETAALAGRGIGYVDAALLTSVVLIDQQLWTFDQRLASVAGDLSVGVDPDSR